MDTTAKIANAWASLEGCAGNLERIIKNSRRLVDERSLELLEEATKAYVERYRHFIEMKKATK